MRLAFIVGIDNYAHDSLDGCENDAKNISNLLLKNFDGSPNFNCMLKLGINSKSILTTSLIDFFNKEAEIAIFYFSGYGISDEFDSYIVTPDVRINDFGIPFSKLLKMANSSRSKEVIIILDTVNSSTSNQSYNFANDHNIHIREGVSILTNKDNIAAPVSVDGEGILTSLICRALNGGAADIQGKVSIASVFSFISNVLGPWELTPLFKTNSSRASSIRKCNPAIEPDSLRQITAYFPEIDSHYQLDPSYEYTSESNDLENSRKFGLLLKLSSLDLVKPVGESHMYWAAMNSKSCKLTQTGQLYWKLVKEGRI